MTPLLPRIKAITSDFCCPLLGPVPGIPAVPGSMPDIHLQWLESAQAKWPEQASTFHKFGNLYQRKLWHQLTVKIDEALQQPGFRQGSLLIPLYENFISAFAHRLNLLRLAHTAVSCRQCLVKATVWDSLTFTSPYPLALRASCTM